MWIGITLPSIGRAVDKVFSCKEDCLRCPYVDCLNKRYGPDVLDWIIEIEKLAGVYLSADAAVYQDEVFEARSIALEQRRLDEEERRINRVKRAQKMKIIKERPYYALGTKRERYFYGKIK